MVQVHLAMLADGICILRYAQSSGHTRPQIPQWSPGTSPLHRFVDPANGLLRGRETGETSIGKCHPEHLIAGGCPTQRVVIALAGEAQAEFISLALVDLLWKVAGVKRRLIWLALNDAVEPWLREWAPL
ncbi:MAG: hypothetical protein ABI389_13530 [Rhodanobacter sp.]